MAVKTPAIGDAVYFYSHANMSKKPCVALVTDVNESGNLVSLEIFRPNQPSIRKSLVRHVDDPYLQQFPDQMRRDGAGAWGYRPCDVKPEASDKRKSA